MKILVYESFFNGVPKEIHAPQVKETCTKCGKYIRFTPQEKWLIDIFNGILEKHPYITMSEERLL